ncbi:MAG TPA: ABC transporter ATP-binding protein [bacterium]|nr:ABC transporter ATP-binding protein [bacterium]
MSAIRLDRVTKIYRRNHFFRTTYRTGVEDFSLEIGDGDVFTLLGLNGSGKTTTVKLILGLLFPDRGDIFIREKRHSGFEMFREVGYLPEVSYYFPYMEAEEMLFFMAGLGDLSGKEMRVRVAAVLEQVGLKDNAGALLKEYSKGMLKRFSLAQTILLDPGILILDEPFSGLDPVGIKQMRELIEEWRRIGKTLFLTSHLITEVEKISNKAGVIHQGHFVRLFDPVVPGRLENDFLESIHEKNS